MSTRPAVVSTATPRLQQERVDTVLRLRLGGVFYVIGWLVICIAADLHQTHTLAAWAIGASFVVGMLVRLRFSTRPLVADHAVWRDIRGGWAIMFASAVLWGMSGAWVLLISNVEAARLVVAICSVALGTAAAQTYAMRVYPAFAVIVLLYLPVLAAFAVSAMALSVTAVLATYFVYLVLLLRRSHAEYQQRLDLEDDLRHQRDLFEQQSRRDGLTGLANRRRFGIELERLVKEATGRMEPFALLILDLDHFKHINDRHGHAIGDACLREFAARLQRAFEGEGELVARLGGEEFGVLIDGSDESAAAARGDAFRQHLAGSPLVLPDIAIGVTVSVGVGAFGPRHRGGGEAFYDAVDQALYRAKAEGRNALRRVSSEME